MVFVWVLLSVLAGCIPFSSCQEPLGPPVTNCPDYVYEGQVLLCDCLPPANLAAAGNVSITVQWAGSLPGLKLVVTDVKRKNSSQTFTCVMLGSVQRNTTYTLKFASRCVPSSAADRLGGHEDISFGSDGNKRVPQKDEYAVVDKSRAKKGPASSANTNISSPAHTTEGSNEYAVVDKSSSQNKAAKKAAFGLSAAATNNAGADVYAQVNKPAKKVKVAEPKREGAAYAQVQKPKPATGKPKTAKPSSDKDVIQRSAVDDDEYHTLSHTRGPPLTQDQADLESQYSHIGHD